MTDWHRDQLSFSCALPLPFLYVTAISDIAVLRCAGESETTAAKAQGYADGVGDSVMGKAKVCCTFLLVQVLES